VIALNAHGDGAAGLGWRLIPRELRSRTARTVLTADFWVAVSKSDFATTSGPARARRGCRADARLAGTIELHFNYDEEVMRFQTGNGCLTSG
jgi:hypothetical protein